MAKKRRVSAKKATRKSMPLGVKIISVLYFIGAALLALGGLAMIFGASALANLVNGFIPISKFSVGTGLFVFAGIFLIAFAVLGFFIGKGLWKGKNWARIVAIILAVWGFVSALGSIVMGSPGAIFNLLIHGIIAYYLWFSSEANRVFA